MLYEVITLDLTEGKRYSISEQSQKVVKALNDDMLKVKGVNFFPKQVESVLLGRPEVGNDYLIEIDRIRGADHLTLHVETEHEFSPRLAQSIDDELYNLLGLHSYNFV